MNFAFSSYGPWTLQFILLALVIRYHQEAQKMALELHNELLLIWLNTNLFLRTWWIYRKMRKDFERMGLPMPAFRYVPLQERINN